MAYRAFSVATICLVILAGCGEDGSTVRPPFVLPTGGTGGTGNSGTGGSGAMGGVGGMGGSGATAGSGGTAGTGGTAATGGTAGTGGAPECVTDALCNACPSQFLCDDDDDCFVGWGCIPSGCTTLQGAAIHQCQPLPGGACLDDDDCPSPSAPDPDYTCENVPLEGTRCVKQTPGCNSDLDCIRGFSCEDGSCFDRRVPCVFDDDCPVSYSCEMPTTSNRFCVRIYETCESDLDCGILAQFCEDIDGDGSRECAGALGLNGPACLNSSCGGTTPVCEASGVGSIAACGKYGLCLNDGECAAGFTCRSLWQDRRKECVPSGGSCGHITECDANQVCASPRNGGAPTCQSSVTP
jgi:hypothetical protein